MVDALPKRVNMTFSAGRWRPVKEVLKRVLPFETPTGAATFILELIAENKELEAAVVTARNSKLLEVTDSNVPSPDHASPDPREDTRAPGTCQERKRERGERDALLAEWRSVEPFCLLPDSAKALARFRRAFPSVDLDAETAKIGQWWDERPSPRPNKPRREGERWKLDGISQGIRGWLERTGKPPRSPSGGPKRNASKQKGFDLPDSTDEIWMKGVDNA